MLLVHTYDFWACFVGVCVYFTVVAIINEVVLSFLLCAVPVGVHYLCQTSLDARLPMRAGLCLVMLFGGAFRVCCIYNIFVYICIYNRIHFGSSNVGWLC